MRNYGKLVANLVQNHLPTMRNYGKLVANCGTKSSTYYEKLC